MNDQHAAPHLMDLHLVRVPPQGRLRTAPQLRQMLWTMPACEPALPKQACVNVGHELAEWGLSAAHVERFGAMAAELCKSAAAVSGAARQAVIVAKDGQRVMLGAVALTRQIFDDRGDPQEPGLIEFIRHLPTSSGVLELPDGRAFFVVADFTPPAASGPADS
ncbi:hypothetical protein [Streptomyces formicae]